MQQNNNTSSSFLVFSIVFSIFLLLASLFVYVAKVLDPLHGPIALTCIYLAYRFSRKVFAGRSFTKNVSKNINNVKKFTAVHKFGVGIVLTIALFVHIFISVVPTGQDVFASIPLQKQSEIVSEDVEVATVLLDRLVLAGDTLLGNPSLYKKELSQEEGSSLKKDWENFILASIETEAMTERHRFFSQISYFKNKKTHVESFVVAYSLYVKKFEIFHKVISAASENPAAVKIFNEYSDRLTIAGFYDDVTSRFFASNSFLRRNLGYLYFSLNEPKETASLSPNYLTLLNVSRESYGYIFKNIFSQVTHRSVVYKDIFDRAAFETWLPIQKTVITDKIGNIHVGDRVSKFITVEQIQEMKKSLVSGDIIVYRKNWYASNLGIPGFWTHAGLYTGTLEEMDVYYKDVFPYRGHPSMSSLLLSDFPEVHKALSEKDSQGFVPSVVESQTHGTLVQSIEKSASVDYVAMVRTNLSKQEVLEAVLTAFSHYGKGYDYAFDLDTKNEIYCSELVYDAYLKTSKNKGVTLPKTLISGRLMVIPNAIIEKFSQEYKQDGAELSFVYFLDASEVTQKAFKSDVEGFLSTLIRPKYSKLLD